ncbi:MAG: uroporphyrinogen-III synthase [Chlorobi bacterium]|nr:uroporphyrinogen-III synthase [Chlorobiota bacterium]
MQKKKIIITAPEIYGNKLKTVLSKYNFNVIQFPTIETVLSDNSEFKTLFSEILTFDYIILPSRNAINSFIKQAKKYHITNKTLQSLKYVTIGKDTELLRNFNLHPELKIKEASTKGIFEALKKINHIKKLAVITPKVKIINEPDIIPDFIKMLQSLAKVYRIDGYITQPVLNYEQKTHKIISQSNYDLIAFTSGAETEALQYILKDDTIFSNLKVACFGPYTASSAVKIGLNPKIIGRNFNSFEGFAEVIIRYFG